jgi:two-component system sensor histidine kinase UhpB
MRGGAKMIRMSVMRTVRGWFSTLPLFWQIFVPNGIVLVVAAAVLALSPASVPSEISTAQALELVGAVALMVLVNLILIRHAVKPLERLTQLMARVDPLEPGQRAPADGGSPEATRLAAVFNEMLERLETERRDSAAKMLSAQERERIRLARELHDEIGQSVTGLMLELDRAAGRAPEELAVELRETQEVARAISSEVREIVRRLRPEALDDLGLKSAIVALTEKFAEQSSIAVERRIEPGLPPLSDEAELVVYRVAQECLTNVARHAEATAVSLEMTKEDAEIVLRVSDDGIGPAQVQPRSGIQGMRERAMLIGAKLEFDRGPAGGLRVTLHVPLGGGR